MMASRTASAGWLLVALVGAVPLAAQERVDQEALSRIRAEGLERSQVLETAIRLSDVNGPRLAGSPGYLRAAEWAAQQMRDWGLSARLEPWGRRGEGWEIERFSAEMTEPRYLNLNAIPKAWSTSTPAPVSGTPVVVRARSLGDLEAYRGRLRGRIVMVGEVVPPQDRFSVPAVRWTEAQLDSLARLTDPGEPRTYWEDSEPWVAALEGREQIERFYHDEGVALLIEPSTNPIALRTTGHVSYTTDPHRRVPALVLARSEFNQILRLIERDVPVRLDVSVRTRFLQPDSLGYNVVGELAGSDPELATQVVLMGGHLDSWHAGTGATDNAAGVAVAMEALRILHATGLQPRRTVRVGLWDGEELEDYHGSMGYVRRHLGDPATMQLLPGQRQLSGYFNIDNGTGRIRGIFTQGNQAVVPIFRELLAPFADLEASTVSIANVGSTDHMPFTAVGVPAFQFIQDRLDYFSRTHHTSLDTADYLVEEDMKQAAVVLAGLMYQVADRDEPLPRTPLPAPRR
jgi:carboxypeptidase Q